MVRLKLEMAWAVWVVLTSFNSSMVRLKPDGVGVTDGDGKFQFLYGAIKTIKSKIRIELIDQFQFLYGAIKTYTP